jgi:hypothetical protein|tara:strand:- start:2280 stop:2792 length:513 start_codon:yes stop_codon:yes gene_type:complete
MSYLDESYLTETLTEKQLCELTYNKSKSLDSLHNLKSSLSTFQYFTQDEFQRDKDQVLKDLVIIYKNNRDTKSTLILLQKFKNWLGEDHDNIITNCGHGGTKKKKAVSAITKKFYLEGVKKWIRLCGNIKIDNDDFRDLVSVKVSELTETEADPVNSEKHQVIVKEFLQQ